MIEGYFNYVDLPIFRQIIIPCWIINLKNENANDVIIRLSFWSLLVIIYEFISLSRARIISSFSHFSPEFAFSKKFAFVSANISYYTIIILLLTVYRVFAFFNLKISLSRESSPEIYLPERENFASFFVYTRAGINSHIEFLRSSRGREKFWLSSLF